MQEGKCSRWSDCKSFRTIGCNGCGFQHFDKVIKANKENHSINYIGDEYFKSCQSRLGTGGRIALDKPIEKLIRNEMPTLNVFKPEAKTINIEGKEISLKLKYDLALESRGKYIFIEIKGYGDNTNDILSAITAAQAVKLITEYKKSNSFYYYLGINSAIDPTGLTRDSFFNKKRTKIYPYIIWAESRNILKFYGIVDIDLLLEEIKGQMKA